jgi:hypothetical protein
VYLTAERTQPLPRFESLFEPSGRLQTRDRLAATLDGDAPAAPFHLSDQLPAARLEVSHWMVVSGGSAQLARPPNLL